MSLSQDQIGYNVDAGRIGIAQETGDGYLRCYIRIARANHPMVYTNRDGKTHIEVVPPETLFNKDSTDSFKMLPLTLQHPEELVTSRNVRKYMRGATGHTVIREGPDSDFLGIVTTIHDHEAVAATKRGWQASPGYRCKSRPTNKDGVFEQIYRDGNHLSIVPLARGGKDVAPVLNGIDYKADEAQVVAWLQRREDSGEVGLISAYLSNRERLAEELNHWDQTDSLRADSENWNADGLIWYQEQTSRALEEIPINFDAISPILHGGGEDKGGYLVVGQPLILPIKQDTISPKNMETVSINIDGVPTQVETSLARIIMPHLQRSERLDSVSTELGETKAKLDAANSKVADLETLVISDPKTDASCGTAKDSNPFAPKPAEGEDEEEMMSKKKGKGKGKMDAADIREQVLQGMAAVDGVRNDGLLLQNLGMIANFNADARTIGSNLTMARKQLLKVAAPGMANRVDAMDEQTLEIAYDTAMSNVRDRAAERQQQPAANQPTTNHADSAQQQINFFEPVRRDAAQVPVQGNMDNGVFSGAGYSHGYGYPQPAYSSMDGQWQQQQQHPGTQQPVAQRSDASFHNSNGIELATLGTLSQPMMVGSREGLLSIMRAADQRDDEAFDEATRIANRTLQVGSRGPLSGTALM